jgi:hypothetical protein
MEYANDYSGYGNEVLYRMCEERPCHDNIDTIMSKLWIIGRAYSAAIERKAGKDFSLKQAAEHIKTSEIDSHISKLKKIDRTSLENVDTLLTAHKYFTDVLKDITDFNKRSLASKYLHFHAPRSVFIFDSIANQRIREIIAPHKRRFKLTRSFDDAYEGFVYRCIHYRDEIFENEINALATPRKIDMELLGYGYDL